MIVLLIKFGAEMDKLATQGMQACEASQRHASRATEKRHWAVGIAITLVVLGLFAIAATFATSSVRANTTLCLKQAANDEHVSLEALFQNPAEQDAFVTAITACSR
jgi:TctA family transporter